MSEVFKIIQGIGKVNLGNLFCIDEDGRIRKQLKIKRNLFSNIGLKFFIRRVIYWNHFTDEVVNCKSLSTFKIRLDEFITAKGKI